MQLLSHPLPPMVPGPMPGRRRALVLLLAVLVLHGVLVFFGPRSGSGNGFDFFTFYLGARAPLTGLSPYETEGVNYDHPAQHAAAAEFFRSCGITGEIPPGMYLPCGIYYPPQAFLLFLPFSRLPWNAALVAWTAFLTLMALPCGTLAWTFDEKRRSPVLETGLIAAFLLNPMTQLMFFSGQVTLILVSAVALGQWLFRRGYPRAGALAWSFVAIKPQLGLPLVLLAFLVGGWRRFRDVSVAIVALNVLGGLVLMGDPLMVLDMFRKSHDYLKYHVNSVHHPLIVSWNRAFYVLGGPPIELTASRVLAGYLVAIALLGTSAVLRGGWRWSPAFWTAAAASAGMCYGLVHGYDLVLLVLLTPYLFWLRDRGYRRDVMFLLGLIGVALVPKSIVTAAVTATHLGPPWDEIAISFRSFDVVALAAYFVLRGQPSQSSGAVPIPRDAAPVTPSRGGDGGPGKGTDYRDIHRQKRQAGVSRPSVADPSRLHEQSVIEQLREDHGTPRVLALSAASSWSN